MLSWFKKKEVQEKDKIVPTNLIDYIGWRNNMWVMTPDGIGIVFKLGTDVEVHIVDKDGYTMQSKLYPILALRQALFNEIPKARRHFTKEQASKLGYK
jgi:hypothetical protein